MLRTHDLSQASKTEFSDLMISDFNVSLNNMRTNDMVVFVDDKGRTKIIKNRYGVHGCVIENPLLLASRRKAFDYNIGDKIIFEGTDDKPMVIRGYNERYVICTRKFNKKMDSHFLRTLVNNGAFMTFSAAYEKHKHDYIYTVLDNKYGMRGSLNLVFNEFGFSTDEHIAEILQSLESGKIDIGKNKLPIEIRRIERI